MNLPIYIEIAISLAFVFMLVSLICSSIRETIAALLNARGKLLSEAIQQLLTGNKKDAVKTVRPIENTKDASSQITADSLFSHPLIAPSLKDKRFPWVGKRLPSEIAPATFATALIDLSKRTRAGESMDPAQLLESIRKSADGCQSSVLDRALAALAEQSNGDFAAFKKSVENWYESTMDRVGGWYRRWTQFALLLLGLTVAVGLNIDTLYLANALYDNEPLRNVVVERAAAAEETVITEDELKPIKESLDALRVNIAWPAPQLEACKAEAEVAVEKDCRGTWVTMILGWIITALAAALGAPIWFQIMKSALSLRGARSKAPGGASAN